MTTQTITEQIADELRARATKAVLTLTTCSIACWMAREEDCRCSCGGKSHGVLLRNGEQPRRNSMIQGFRYVLGAIEAGGAARNLSWDFRKTLDRETYGTHLRGRIFSPRENEPGATIWLKKASAAQLEKWPEVAEWSEGVYQRQMQRHEELTRGRSVPAYYAPKPGQRPYLVWVREDVADQFDAFAAARESAA